MRLHDWMTRGTPILTLVAVLACSALTGPAPSPLRHLRSPDPDQRLEALRALVADPTRVEARLRDRTVVTLRKLLETERNPVSRGLAARGLRALGGPVDLLAVVRRLGREIDDRAHPDMITALEGVTDEHVVDAVCEAAARLEDPRLRGVMVLALGGMPGDRALRTLHRLAALRHPWPVVASALIALGRKRHRDVIPLLIRKLRDRDAGFRAMAHDSLVRLTGHACEEDPERWERWWEEVGDRFRFPDPDRSPLPGAARPYGREDPVVPRYYGIPIRGTRLVFCFDLSASMWGPTKATADEELIRAVKTLPPRRLFSVLFFNERVWPWREDPCPALPWPKEALFAHLPTLETKSYTNIHDALERALGLAGRGRFARDPAPGVDDIFLISDGEPNRGRFRDLRGITTSIRRLNTPRVARIHCIALGDKPRALLEKIAAENGGRFVDGRE
jgi:HEAT repeat protein